MGATIGERLKEARLAAGMSARALAEATEGSHANIIRIESGAQPKPGAEKIAAFARVLGVSTEWLLTGQGPREKPGHVVELDDPYPTRADAIARMRGVVSDEAIASVRAVQNLGGLTVQEWVEELIRADRLRSKLVVDSVRHTGGGPVGMPSKLPRRPRS